jgi:hypothetical protein
MLDELPHGTTEKLIPVKIGSFEPLSEEEFTLLRQQKAQDRPGHGRPPGRGRNRPVRVPLVEGQSARGLRTAISRVATSRGLFVETVEGDGFVAVRKANDPRTRKGKQAPSQDGQRRRGRPPKRRDQDADEIASLQDLAAGGELELEQSQIVMRQRAKSRVAMPPPRQKGHQPSLGSGVGSAPRR